MTNQPAHILPSLSDEERAVYEWQLWVREFGETGQRRLKKASVLVSRCGGLGGVVAYELAAAGVGKLVLAHAGNVRPSDLNRQLLMTHAGIGQSRIASVKERLLELNPRLEIVAVAENVTEQNAERLVAQADLIVDCAPLFTERFELNRQAVRQNKPLIECAVYELEGQITSILPGKTPCLSCLYPENPPVWKREFPIFGAVAGVLGCLAATEAIKLLSGLGEPLTGQLLTCDLADMTFRRRRIERNPNCPVCKTASC
jgi:molybdopterin/thiamine biosynthesis adenylyltransferase